MSLTKSASRSRIREGKNCKSYAYLHRRTHGLPSMSHGAITTAMEATKLEGLDRYNRREHATRTRN